MGKRAGTLESLGRMTDLSFYKGHRVLVTGHTGFKGSWMCRILTDLGAQVAGYSRCSVKEHSLFELLELDKSLASVAGDICSLGSLKKVFEEFRPEIVIHMAAQPIVREGYSEPVKTYETNVMGTVNVLECVRCYDSVKSFLNVTTDKVYENKEWPWSYRENENLNGRDPYSNSKSCSELVTYCYKNSFFTDRNCAISTARAGNVIGGGDWAKDRIIPDCIRASANGEKIFLRNPSSIRPYQHVLEPVVAYLLIAAKQYEDASFAGNYNIGPNESDCVSTGELADIFCRAWGGDSQWISCAEPGAPKEANLLKLDSSLFKTTFAWAPHWNISQAVEKTVEWSKAWLSGEDMNKTTREQIASYMGE